MRKLILIAVVVVAVAAVWVGAASANEGPHGGYTTTTDACAGCHRTHTAPEAQLLFDTDPGLCLSCHGAAGAGANTNVEGGIFDNSWAASNGLGTLDEPLQGGGFVQWQHENQGGFAAVSSIHNPSAVFGTGNATGAWGDGVARGTRAATGVTGGFRCSACHDPHGSGNWRIIRETVNGVALAAGTVTSADGGPDEGGKSYTTDSADDYGAGISTFCAACHLTYHEVDDDQGSTFDGGSYTHRIDMAYNDPPYAALDNPETVGYTGPGGGGLYHLPLADATGAGGTGVTVTCLTCHVAHGTSAAMAGWAAGAYDPDGAGPLGPVPTGDSALLRIPNRGVCEVCHQKG